MGDTSEAQGSPVWRIVGGLSLFVLVPGGVALLGMTAMLMMAFMTDAGARDPELLEVSFVTVICGLGLMALAGPVSAFGVWLPGARRPLMISTAVCVALGLLVGVCGFGLHLYAVMR